MKSKVQSQKFTEKLLKTSIDDRNKYVPASFCFNYQVITL